MTMPWKPLLSATVPIDPATGDFDWSVIPFPVYASPKLDGYRAMVQGGVLVSRNGLAVRNVELQKRYGRNEYEGLDGELCSGWPASPGVFGRTSSVVKKAAADAKDTALWVIDYMAHKNAVSFNLTQRISVLTNTYDWGAHRVFGLRLIPQTLISSVAALKAYEKKMLVAGYEGVMLRRADQGVYPQKPGKQNRSTLNEFWLARLKRFEHDYAVIIAFHPLMHNLNKDRTATGARSTKKAGKVVDAQGRVGSVTLRDVKTGVEFETTVGAEALRTWNGWPSAIGEIVRYKWQVCGTKDKPRINTCAFDELRLHNDARLNAL